ncbi:MAG: DNA-directed RNA polymerase subunit alpha C-terminal domain-containing protein [Planctomycetota bacterium]|jgi:hypothetical protein
MTLQQYVLAALSSSPSGRRRKQRELIARLDRPFQVTPTWNYHLVRDVKLDDLDLPSRARTVFPDIPVSTVGELLAVLRWDLLSQRRLGQVSLSRVRDELIDLIWMPTLSDREITRLGSFSAVVTKYVRRLVPNPRKADMVLRRLAPNARSPQPLQDIGKRHALSRERIRQLVAEASDRLTKPAKLAQLEPFWRQAWSVLQSWDRPISLQRLAEGLHHRFNWRSAPHEEALERFLVLHPEMEAANRMVTLRPIVPLPKHASLSQLLAIVPGKPIAPLPTTDRPRRPRPSAGQRQP